MDLIYVALQATLKNIESSRIVTDKEEKEGNIMYEYDDEVLNYLKIYS